MAKGTRRPNTVAQTAADTAAQQEADLQSAINSVVIDNLAVITGAIATRDTLARDLEKARIAVGSTKLTAFDAIAKAAFDGAWTDPQCAIAIEAAMRVWAGNETIDGVTPEQRLKGKTAERLRSELAIPMLPEVRSNFVTIIQRAQEAWDAEGAELAATSPLLAWNHADAPTPLRKAFYNRFAEMALRHLRDARITPATDKKAAVPGVIHADRDAMVAAAATKAKRSAKTPTAPAETVHAVPPTSAEAAGAQVAAILAAIDKLGTEWNATELLADVREAFRKVASGAVLAKRKAGVVLAPSGAENAAAAEAAKRAEVAAAAEAAKAAAATKAAEPVEGASDLESALEQELALVRQLNALRASRGK